ncbi:MAG: hypothetical protein KI790_16215 [Cyclobacteriaceae bacterium]|nr:hypothetical protein [Cyclobacteriaceae bacterium HetDA_MAG_MS6]
MKVEVMDPQSWEDWILQEYQGVVMKNAYRERSFFYNPGRMLPHGVYFSTIKESDGPNDAFSNLDRDGVFRISMGLGKQKYQEIFGGVPKRASKGESPVAGLWDFHQLDLLTPHPVYAWMGWVCILNPGPINQRVVKTIIEDSYDRAVASFNEKMREQTRE